MSTPAAVLPAAPAVGQESGDTRSVAEKQTLLWSKLEVAVREISGRLNGVMAVAIRDLTNGDTILVLGDEVMPQASSIKIAVLAELYHQAQQAEAGVAGKARLTDTYVVRTADLVPGSDIMSGLTPGVTRLTLRDLATLMVAVSDNSATNVLIDRLGMEQVNGFLDSLGLQRTRLRRKMMDLSAAREGRENVSTPREMMLLLEKIYRHEALSAPLAADFFAVLSTHKASDIPRDLPEGLQIANKPGWLEAVRTDSGIVFVKNRPFVLCAMTTFLRNDREGSEAISQVAAAAFAYFDRIAKGSEYGRVISPR